MTLVARFTNPTGVALDSWDMNNLRSAFRYDRARGYVALRPRVAAALGLANYDSSATYIAGPIQDRAVALRLIDPATVQRAPPGSLHLFTAEAQQAHVQALQAHVQVAPQSGLLATTKAKIVAGAAALLALGLAAAAARRR